MIKKRFLLFFIINLFFLLTYIFIFVETFNLGNLDIELKNPSFSRDTLIGSLIAKNSSEFSIIDRILSFNNSLIYLFFNIFFDIGNLFYTSILNSLIVSYVFFKKRVSTYLLFLPVVIPFSVGINKEIFMILSFFILINSLDLEKKQICSNGLIFAFIIICFTRIYFLTLYFSTIFSQKFKLDIILLLYLFISILLGIFISEFKFLFNLHYFFLNKIDSFSYQFFSYIDLSYFNQLFYAPINVLKLLFEPFLHLNPTKLFSFSQGYLMLLFIVHLNKIIKSKFLFKIILVNFLVISFIPFVHFRYLFSLITVIILFTKK